MACLHLQVLDIAQKELIVWNLLEDREPAVQ